MTTFPNLGGGGRGVLNRINVIKRIEEGGIQDQIAKFFQINEMGREGFDGMTEFSELMEFWEGEILTGRHEIMKYMKGWLRGSKGVARIMAFPNSCGGRPVWEGRVGNDGKKGKHDQISKLTKFPNLGGWTEFGFGNEEIIL